MNLRTVKYQEKQQILAVRPFCNTTEYIQFGIISEIPNMCRGKVLSKEVEDSVQDLYQCDEISRVCSRNNTIGVQNPFTRKIITCSEKNF